MAALSNEGFFMFLLEERMNAEARVLIDDRRLISFASKLTKWLHDSNQNVPTDSLIALLDSIEAQIAQTTAVCSVPASLYKDEALHGISSPKTLEREMNQLVNV